MAQLPLCTVVPSTIDPSTIDLRAPDLRAGLLHRPDLGAATRRIAHCALLALVAVLIVAGTAAAQDRRQNQPGSVSLV